MAYRIAALCLVAVPFAIGCLAPPPGGMEAAAPLGFAAEAAGICTEESSAAEIELAAQAFGVVDANAVQRATHARLPQLTGCYAGPYGQNRDLMGRTTLQALVDSGGQVSQLRVQENSFPNCEAVRCIARTFREMRFPAPQCGPALVTLELAESVDHGIDRGLMRGEPSGRFTDGQFPVSSIGVNVVVHEGASTCAAPPAPRVATTRPGG